MGWATLWAIFSQTPQVTLFFLLTKCYQSIDKLLTREPMYIHSWYWNSVTRQLENKTNVMQNYSYGALLEKTFLMI
jgi:hypothetical protein